MSVLSGYGKYKRYVLTSTGYKLCSQWTSSNTVHFDDNKTAQTKLGAINGITDSLTATSSNVALSAKAGKNLQDQVTTLNTGLGNIIFEENILSGVNGVTTYNSSFVIKSAQVKQLNFNIVVNGSKHQWETIANFKGTKFLPYANYYTEISIAGVGALIMIRADGRIDLMPYADITNTQMYFTAIYI